MIPACIRHNRSIVVRKIIIKIDGPISIRVCKIDQNKKEKKREKKKHQRIQCTAIAKLLLPLLEVTRPCVNTGLYIYVFKEESRKARSLEPIYKPYTQENKTNAREIDGGVREEEEDTLIIIAAAAAAEYLYARKRLNNIPKRGAADGNGITGASRNREGLSLLSRSHQRDNNIYTHTQSGYTGGNMPKNENHRLSARKDPLNRYPTSDYLYTPARVYIYT